MTVPPVQAAVESPFSAHLRKEFMRSAPVQLLTALALAVLMIGAARVDSTAGPVRSHIAPANDSIAGEWTANGNDPHWDGRFVLKLVLTQQRDSVHGTYQFLFDGAGARAPDDVVGTFENGRLQLTDRRDRFWLTATLRGDHLDGRLAGGSGNRSSSASISFVRVKK